MKCFAKLVLLCSLLACTPVLCPPAEATVSTTAPRNDYVGTGATATYSYTFKIFAATDLRVTTRTTANVETTLTYPTDYTVTGVGSTSGGTIVLTAGNLTSGYALTIRFDRTPRQSTDLRNQGSFFPQTHEDKFDELTRYSQQLEDVVDRSLHLPETEVGTAAKTTLPVAADRASKYLAFDADGEPVATDGGFSTPVVTAFAETLLDDSTAAAAAATLAVLPLSGGTLTGGLITNSAISSTKACASGYTRITPHFCKAVLPIVAAYTPSASCAAHVLDANLDTNNLVMIKVRWRTKANNGAGARTGSTNFAGSSAVCAATTANTNFSTYEQAAVAAGTVISEGSDIILQATLAGTVHSTDANAGGNGTSEIVSIESLGYYNNTGTN